MIRTQIRLYSSIGYDLLFPTDSYYVLGYTKSGTNWLCAILSTLLEIPVYEPWQSRGMAWSKQIYHVHRFIPFRTIENRTCYLLRDGRDAMISRYYAMLNMPDQVGERRAFATYVGDQPSEENIRENLAKWIMYLATNNRSSIDWSSHVKHAMGRYQNILRFEDLRNGETYALQKALVNLTGYEFHQNDLKKALSDHSFDKAKKTSGSPYEQAFLRSGISGEWKQKFNEEAANVFYKYAGNTLIMAGYELNNNWISEYK